MRFGAVKTSAVRPQATGSRARRSDFREVLADQIQIVQNRHDRAPLAMPAQDELQQVGGGPHVDGGERLIHQNQSGVLQQHAGEQHPLKLAARQ